MKLRAQAARLAVLLGILAVSAAPARAEMTVPLDMQAELLCKVVRFERGFIRRSGNAIRTLLVDLPSDPKSKLVAKQMTAELARHRVADKPLAITNHHFTSAVALRTAAEASGATIVYLAPGLDTHVKEIAAAFEGLAVITVSADGDQIASGIVLGFELVASRPRIEINLAQARKQKLDFNSDLFRLAKVFQ
jgi:hypothetical protein